VLAKDMIEPKRKFTDMTKVWAKLRSKRSGGPGGLLQLTVVQARELRYASACIRRFPWLCRLLARCQPHAGVRLTSSLCEQRAK